jgi:hypothetical protein
MGVTVSMSSVMYNCTLVNAVLIETVNSLRRKDPAQVIDFKELHKLTWQFKGGMLQIFRAQCLAEISKRPEMLMRVGMLYNMMLRACQDLTTVYLLLGMKLPRILKYVSDEKFRRYLFKLHRKEFPQPDDEISCHESDRIRRLCAEWN